MRSHVTSVFRLAALSVAVTVLASSMAAAQTPAPTPPVRGPTHTEPSLSTAAVDANAQLALTTEARPAIRVPSLTFSLGVGTASSDQDSKLLQAVSAQWLLRRNVLIEGEATRWSSPWNRVLLGAGFHDSGIRSGWSAGGNLLFRMEPRRVSAFVGGGVMLAADRNVWRRRGEGCAPPNSCSPTDQDDRRRQVGLQGVGGVDVRIAGPLIAYAAVQVTSAEGANVRLSAGARVIAATRSLAVLEGARARRLENDGGRALVPVVPAAGRNVRISFASGERRTASFLGLSTTELRVRERGRDIRYPLDQVLLVETTHNTAPFAAIGGALAALVVGATMGTRLDLPSEGIVLFAGAGAGIGALIGMARNRANAHKHVVYVAP